MAERSWRLNDTAPLPLAQEDTPPTTAGTFAPHATPTQLQAFSPGAAPWSAYWWGGLASMLQPASATVFVDGGEIGSAEAFGAPTVALSASAGGGVPSGQAFGAGTAAFTVSTGGDLASTESFGAGQFLPLAEEPQPDDDGGWPVLTLSPRARRRRRSTIESRAGIPSAESFGRGQVLHRPNEEAEAEDDAVAVLLIGGLA